MTSLFFKKEEQPPAAAGNRVVSFLLGIGAWFVALLFFFPIFWMVLNGFKTELDANGDPLLFFSPTLGRYGDVTGTVPGLTFSEAFTNSAIIVGVSTIIVLAMAIPAAYSLSILSLIHI